MRNKIYLILTLMSVSLIFGQVGINTENPQGIFNIDGGKNNAVTGTPTATQLKDDFIITSKGSAGIGTLPDSYAALDVKSANQGILAPRINLTSVNLDLNADGDNSIANQPKGLLVYNTADSPTSLTEGYYFWNGMEWRRIDNKSSAAPKVTLQCGQAYLEPAQSITGGVSVLPGTILKIPYVAGNGGGYNGVVLSSVGNQALTATLSGGTLAEGSGSLILNISGTPTAAQQAPGGISFDLTPFYTANPSIINSCSSVTVGKEVRADIQTIATMDFLKYVVDPNTNTRGFQVALTTPDGLYSIRVFLRHDNQTSGTAANNNNQVQNADVQIKNNTPVNKTLMYNHLGGYGGGTTNSSGNSVLLPSNQWGGTTDNTWHQATPSTRGNWADPGIYQGANSGPEFRYYSWIEQGTTKTAYLVTVMAGANSGPFGTLPSDMKVYIKIEQITAP
ncbi:hypothetical protein [Chryseobacterium lathyri]|uniref:hypothetical protein n=1 Tax=Chryseobacterium lathyri TaxID=395933 RepID=UPI002789F404|nr:hypothetical protein [Chryseobacterium lathyri]MDQ0064387.1 hypothetical protein [Chryseobacterium lathyri]